MRNSVALRFSTTTIVGASVVLTCVCGATVHAAETLEMAITTSDLQRYEKLYAKIDVEIERQYTAKDSRLGGDDQPQRRAGAGLRLVPQRPPAFHFVNQIGGFNELLKRTETIHLVSQDEKLRMDWKGVGRFANDTTHSWRRVLLCDGKATRFYDDAPLRQCCSISRALEEMADLQPHGVLFAGWNLRKPLSAYLKGDRGREVVFQGDEECQGLKCRRIRITDAPKPGQKPWHWIDVWLAETRNLIPARALEYRPHASVDSPYAEATVNRWQELKPGVWFPMTAVTTVYDLALPKGERAHKPRLVERHTVKRVSLEPNYGPAFFQEFDRGP